jgi:microsomal dipeptidase-like Zn-dependent dipeptidase
VGLGTDLDGGFDAAGSAMQDTRQFPELARKLRKHFSPPQVEGVMGANWLEFLARSLPD